MVRNSFIAISLNKNTNTPTLETTYATGYNDIIDMMQKHNKTYIFALNKAMKGSQNAFVLAFQSQLLSTVIYQLYKASKFALSKTGKSWISHHSLVTAVIQ